MRQRLVRTWAASLLVTLLVGFTSQTAFASKEMDHLTIVPKVTPRRPAVSSTGPRAGRPPAVGAPKVRVRPTSKATPHLENHVEAPAAQHVEAASTLAHERTTPVTRAAAVKRVPITVTSNNPNRLLVREDGFDVVYDASRKAPLFITYKITPARYGDPSTHASRNASERRLQSDTAGPAPEFHEANLPKGVARATLKDYPGTGYDRSHGAASGDLPSFIDGSYVGANQATYSLANQVPHRPNVNRGPWNHLENYYRKVVHDQKKDVGIKIGHWFDGPKLEQDKSGGWKFGNVKVATGSNGQPDAGSLAAATDKAWNTWLKANPGEVKEDYVIGDGVRVPRYSGKVVSISKPGTRDQDISPENTKMLWVIIPNNRDVPITDHFANYLVSPAEFVKKMGWTKTLEELSPAQRQAFLSQPAPHVEFVEGGAKIDGEFVGNHQPKGMGGGRPFVDNTGGAWRHDPVSDNQLKALARKGITVPAGVSLTKGQASDLMDGKTLAEVTSAPSAAAPTATKTANASASNASATKNSGWKATNDAWRKAPASAGQLERLRENGIAHPAGITGGEASDLYQAWKNKKAAAPSPAQAQL